MPSQRDVSAWLVAAAPVVAGCATRLLDPADLAQPDLGVVDAALDLPAACEGLKGSVKELLGAPANISARSCKSAADCTFVVTTCSLGPDKTCGGYLNAQGAPALQQILRSWTADGCEAWWMAVFGNCSCPAGPPPPATCAKNGLCAPKRSLPAYGRNITSRNRRSRSS